MKPCILSLFSLLFSLGSLAQPVLTSPDISSILGINLNYKLCTSQSLSYSQSGPNQIWNFSAVQVQDSTPWICELDTIFPSNSVTIKNVSFHSQTAAFYSHYHYSFSADSLTAIRSTEFPIWCSNDHQVILKYPMNFLDTLINIKNDCIFAPMPAGGGSQDVFKAKYVAYGTLILPNLNYSNVACISYTTNWSGRNSTNFYYTRRDTVYNWYVPQFPFPVAQLTKTTEQISGSGSFSMGHFYYLESNVLGQDELKNSTAIKVFPNPAKDQLNVCSSHYNGYEKYTIHDLLGRPLLDGKIDKNSNQIVVDISNLNSGYYFISISGKNAEQVTKFTVLH